MSCRQCGPTFSVKHLFEWTHHGRRGVMHPNYLLELRAVRDGRPVRLAGTGQRVRLLVPGRLHGRIGRVVKLARTSYHVELPEGRYRVVFAAAEPVDG
jgi:hypothetical protein